MGIVGDAHQICKKTRPKIILFLLFSIKVKFTSITRLPPRIVLREALIFFFSPGVICTSIIYIQPVKRSIVCFSGTHFCTNYYRIVGNKKILSRMARKKSLEILRCVKYCDWSKPADYLSFPTWQTCG